MEAEESELTVQLDEVSHVKWMTKSEVLEANCFESVRGFANNFLK